MSKKGATSSRFEAAKSGAEEHNRREKDLDYIRKDLSHLNRTWEAPDFVSVEDARKKVADKYYEHHTTKKGTHKNLPSNATPIQETVLVINENTTMDELKDFARMVQETWGYRPLAIYTHLDEGHKNAWNRGEWIPNRHAHLIFDSTDSNGDSLKPLSESRRESIKNKFEKNEREKAKADPSYVPREWVEPAEWARIKPFDYMQDLAATALHMERGEKSGRKAQKAMEYKNAKLAEDHEQLLQKNQELRQDNAALESKKSTLSDEIAEKEATKEELSKGTGFLARASSKLGFSVGEDAAIRKELKELQDSLPGKLNTAKEEGKEEGRNEAKKKIFDATGLKTDNPKGVDALSVDAVAKGVGNYVKDTYKKNQDLQKENQVLGKVVQNMKAIPLIDACIQIIRNFVHHFTHRFTADERTTLAMALQGDESKAENLKALAYYECGIIGQSQYNSRWNEAERQLRGIARGETPELEQSRSRGLGL